MDGLIGNRLLKHFLKGIHRASKSGSSSKTETLIIVQRKLKMIDEEVQRIITEQYERAQTLLMIHRSALETVTQKLLKTETIDDTVVKEALVDTEKDKKEPNHDSHPR